MISLRRPSFTALASFRACIKTLRRKTREKFEKIEDTIVEEARLYEENAAEFRLYVPASATAVASPDGTVTVAAHAMVELYNQKMAQPSRPKRESRVIYEALKELASECPFCGHSEIDTLEHHLDKALYPALAVCPLNLIPSCFRCNKNKYENLKAHHAEKPVHPYFDNFDETNWLRAEILEQIPPKAQFGVDRACGLAPSSIARLEQQMIVMELDTRYALKFDQHLGGKKRRFRELIQTVGSEQFRAYLRDEESSEREARKNSWQAAAYAAMAESVFFYEGRWLPP